MPFFFSAHPKNALKKRARSVAMMFLKGKKKVCQVLEIPDITDFSSIMGVGGRDRENTK